LVVAIMFNLTATTHPKVLGKNALFIDC